MSTTRTTPAEAGETGLQSRAIGFWGAAALSIAAMGPLLGALSVAPLIVSQAGYSAPFIFVACWIAMVSVALTIGRFARVLPGAASIYSYISHGLGERFGFLAAWLSFSYFLLFVPWLLLGFGTYAESGFDTVLGINLPWWVWTLIGTGIVGTLATVGIALSLRIDLALALLCDGFLVLLSVIIIFKVANAGDFTLEPLAPTNAPGSFTGLALAIAFGTVIFLGFEQSFVLGEEARDPRREVPRAIIFSLGLVGLVLFLATFALVLGFGPTGIGRLNGLFTSAGTPWFALVTQRIGKGWTDVLQILIVLSILSNTIASTNAVVRIMYGMGRAGALPRSLGRTARRFRTPHVAIAVAGVFTLLVSLVPALVTSPAEAFGFMGFGIGFSAAVTFILVAVAGLRYFHRFKDGTGVFGNYLVPALAIVILVPVVITSFYPDPGPALKWAPYAALAWLILGVVYLIARERRDEPIDLDYAFREADQPAVGGADPATTVTA
jgi:amino acid transporter